MARGAALMWQAAIGNQRGAWLAMAALALVALRYLEQNVAQAGLWLFVGLTLSTGFFHGALDIVLLRREFVGARRLAWATLAYAATVVLLAFVCAHNGWLTMLLLLLMSVWHFGEPYGRWAQGAWASRVIAGGAPLMLPALLSTQALQSVLPMAVGLDAALAWVIWQTLAWMWVAVCAVALIFLRKQLLPQALWIEVSSLVAINLALSPLMAFALYFGVFHSAAHICRITALPRCGEASEQTNPGNRTFKLRIVLATILTSAATLALLFALDRYLQRTAIDVSEQHHLLTELLLALTAVTLPHLVLVSRNAHLLTTRRPAD